MASDRRYNPVIFSRLQALCGQKDWEGLVRYLQGLPHSGFRTAGLLLGDRLLADAPEDDYWAAFRRLLDYDAKALLGTLLKTAVVRLGRGTLSLRHPGFGVVAHFLNTYNREVDKHKVLLRLVPALPVHTDIDYLFDRLHVAAPRKRLDYLLRGDTLPCYFLLFRTLRFLEHDKTLLTDCCRYLMKKGDALSFNLASLAKLYFDLPQVKGTFSLRFQPYEVGRLEASFELFAKALTSM